MKNNLIVVMIVSVLVAYGTVKLTGLAPDGVPQPAVRETAYQRLMRTKTLRCGWFAEPPFTIFDANTGEHSGIVPAIMARFAADYDVKITWETIANFAMMGEDLKEGKYDAICASLINMPRGGLIDSIDPFAYVPIYGYVRTDETRLTSLAAVNDPAYRIAGQEGGAVLTTARQKFPKAQFALIPSADLADTFASVVAGKADVAFEIPTAFQNFAQNNPGLLKPLDPAQPMQLFVFAFGVRPEEDGLKSLLNNVLQRMIVSGDLAALYARYDPAGTLMYPAVNKATRPVP